MFIPRYEQLGIDQLAIKMRSTPYSSVLMTAIVCLASIPPLIGFTLSVTMCGYVFGFPFGLLPATLGAFSGALITFALIRMLHLSDWLKSGKRFSAISRAIQKGGIKMVVLIRSSPIPWHLTSIMLSVNDHIGFNVYCIAACIGSFKLTSTVWVGSQLASLNDPNLPPEAHRYTLISLGIGLTTLAITGVWIYRLTIQQIKEKKAEEEPLLGYRNVSTKCSYT
ncbi:hypothetical protein [Parasitella parasitica]|uniref:Golgi apparatus membrane protein TVP38 n=1 Tax=Parasitella parasitica TaxID=35722 RepID=A0A0B7N4P2_9FUNG|nr:hypothetical protein [Parasitella parasitica]